MAEDNMKRASLADVRRMKEKGLFHDPKAPDGENLGADFWAKAEIRDPKKSRSVHLKLDPDVFDFFYSQARGKGHLTRMQDVCGHTPALEPRARRISHRDNIWSTFRAAPCRRSCTAFRGRSCAADL